MRPILLIMCNNCNKIIFFILFIFLRQLKETFEF